MASTLDRIDLALIRALQKDGRASNKELAATVGLAPSSTHSRLKRLVETGVVRGVHADVDPAALGVGLQALLFLRLATHGRNTARRVWESLAELPEVVVAYYVGGDDDVVLHVAVRDTHHLRDLVLDRVAVEDTIARVRTEILFDRYRSPRHPDYVA
ncbi:MAG: Lrp/AsnC family transcriptional regulator [Myxococcales bacterium]|nr:Lrp/AsnC family transcriptional regulator [Myxococcales bacterium]